MIPLSGEGMTMAVFTDAEAIVKVTAA